MDWYIVIKTIKRNRYYYWQKTYRVGKQVKTLNKYIGPVKKVSAPFKAPSPNWGPNLTPSQEYEAARLAHRNAAPFKSALEAIQSPTYKAMKDAQKKLNVLTQIQAALAKKGHSKDRIAAVINEAKASSNPAYILHYWGVPEKLANQFSTQAPIITKPDISGYKKRERADLEGTFCMAYIDQRNLYTDQKKIDELHAFAAKATDQQLHNGIEQLKGEKETRDAYAELIAGYNTQSPSPSTASEKSDTVKAKESTLTSNSEKVRQLNDEFRKKPVTKGTIVMTAGLQAMGSDFIGKAIAAMQAFDAFTEANDSHGEHDFFFFEVDGTKCFFKIDCYDENFQYHSEDATDPKKTRRVGTLGLAEDY